MKKTLFWIVFLLGLYFTIGTIIIIFYHPEIIADGFAIRRIPFVLFNTLLDFITNPGGWLWIVLVISIVVIKKKLKKDK